MQSSHFSLPHKGKLSLEESKCGILFHYRFSENLKTHYNFFYSHRKIKYLFHHSNIVVPLSQCASELLDCIDEENPDRLRLLHPSAKFYAKIF